MSNYKILKPNDILESGDEWCYVIDQNNWTLLSEVLYGKCVRDFDLGSCVFRRKIKENEESEDTEEKRKQMIFFFGYDTYLGKVIR